MSMIFAEGVVDAHLRAAERYAAVLEEHNLELKLEIIRLQNQLAEIQGAAMIERTAPAGP